MPTLPQPPKKRFRRETAVPRGEPTMVGHLLRRSWAIVLLGAVAAAVTWWVVHDDAKTYERTLTFVILPSPELDVSEIPNALRSLDQQSSQISGTIATVVGSKAALRQAANETLGTGPGPGYTIRSGVRPGSDALTIRLQGPRAATLARLAPAIAANTIDWVDSNMRSYRLQQLDSQASDGPIAPKTFQLVAVAAFLAAALAFAAAYLERSSRAARRESAPSTGPHVVTGIDDAGAEGSEAPSSRILHYGIDPERERRQGGETRRGP